MCPLKLDFFTLNNKGDEDVTRKSHAQGASQVYSIIYKNGDDVRQDQLVLQIIQLMDFLLQQVNLDFKFTAYKTLAFTKDDGMLEFVNKSHTIQDII